MVSVAKSRVRNSAKFQDGVRIWYPSCDLSRPVLGESHSLMALVTVQLSVYVSITGVYRYVCIATDLFIPRKF